MAATPTTKYARSGDVHIAYQVVDEVTRVDLGVGAWRRATVRWGRWALGLSGPGPSASVRPPAARTARQPDSSSGRCRPECPMIDT